VDSSRLDNPQSATSSANEKLMEQQMGKPSFQEWFCLEQGRTNFQIDPVRDREVLLGQPEWEEEINSRLRRAGILGTPVRLLWWGQFGIGKTHRLHHTEYLIRKNGYRYYACYVVASDLQEKTGFERLHYELINSLGRAEIKRLVSSYLLKIKTNPGQVPSLKEICNNSADVEAALQSFGGDLQNPKLPAWRFLCGLELRGNEMALAGVTKEQLDSSHDFSSVLAAIGKIIRVETGNELIYLIDEAENLTKITNKTAEARWQECLRSFLDIQHISVVITVGAERFQDMPRLLILADVVRRLQKDNYLHMEAYKLNDVTKFLEGLLRAWIDPSKRSRLEAAEGLAQTVPGYKPELFPFNEGAFRKFCDYAVVDPRTAKPSEILNRLNTVAAEAYFRDQRVIDQNLLTELGIA